jgi:hypothetical protein
MQAISLVAAAAFWAFAEWRLGLLLSLAIAILQDLLRKPTPDPPDAIIFAYQLVREAQPDPFLTLSRVCFCSQF